MNEALKEAAGFGHTDCVFALLERGSDANTVGNFGSPLLMEAVEWNHLKTMVMDLLRFGADANLRGKDGRTALMVAAANGSAEIVTELLKYGANVDDVEKYGRNALMYAAAAIEANVDNNVDFLDENQADMLGNAQSAQVLVEHGINIDATDFQGRTALMWAAESGMLSVVQRLIALKADVHIRDLTGNTALTHAIKQKKTEVIQILTATESCKG